MWHEEIPPMVLIMTNILCKFNIEAIADTPKLTELYVNYTTWKESTKFPLENERFTT